MSANPTLLAPFTCTVICQLCFVCCSHAPDAHNDLPRSLVSSYRCYVQLLSADPCWPKVAVHVLFQNSTTLRQWLDWVKFQKNRAWSGAAVDKGAVPDGVKRVVARLETGQLGPINSAAVVQQGNDSSEKAIIATDLGL